MMAVRWFQRFHARFIIKEEDRTLNIEHSTLNFKPRTYSNSYCHWRAKVHAEISRTFRLLAKRQRTGALQDASRISGIIVSRAASWTAAALRRFSQRHIKLCPC